MKPVLLFLFSFLKTRDGHKFLVVFHANFVAILPVIRRLLEARKRLCQHCDALHRYVMKDRNKFVRYHNTKFKTLLKIAIARFLAQGYLYNIADLSEQMK